RGKRLLTIAHLGKLPARKGETKGADHWVPVGVDGSDLKFLYGDSMCGQKTPVMPPALFKAFTTWKSYHTSAEFTMAPIEITQQADNTSCGPCALNAINCLACPELDELAKPEDIACVRLWTLHNIISHVIDMADNTGVSTASEASELTDWDDEDDESQESFESMVKGAKFTFRHSLPPSSPIHPPLLAPNHALQPTFTPEKRSRQGSISCVSESMKKLKPDIPSALKHTDTLIKPTDREGDSTLGKFFPKISHVEKVKADKREFEDKEARLLKVRADGKKRQQVYRDKKREQKIANGWEPKRGKKQTLQDFDDDPDDNLAEASRPRWGLKDDIRLSKKKAHPEGRRATKVVKVASRMNYFQPLVWSQVQAAVRQVGYPWKQVDICRAAKLANPQTFAQLTPKTVGRWIDPDAHKRGVHKWKDSVLEYVKHGNAPGGKTTRRGILDSYPEVCEMINTQLNVM
ncbi:hypothetical protein F5050DRAFT_1716598, partial [Lentinula boryana]